MSIPLTSAVWKRSKQKKSGALLVLLAIADYANERGIAWPAVSTLARKARMSTRNVQRWLRCLERDGELRVRRNQGRCGANIYEIYLPVGNPAEGDTHVTGDTCGAKLVTQLSSTTDAGVIQSVSESSIQKTPVVPTGDDVDFWIKTCFRCFEQPVRALRSHVLRALCAAIPALNKSNAESLVEFYQTGRLDSKEPPYSSRRHSPERLILDLPRQLALAVQICPPTEAPKKPAFTIEEVRAYLSETYPGCNLPHSLDDLDAPWCQDIKREVEDAMWARSKTRPNSGAG
jgi:hypothetical protein